MFDGYFKLKTVDSNIWILQSNYYRSTLFIDVSRTLLMIVQIHKNTYFHVNTIMVKSSHKVNTLKHSTDNFLFQLQACALVSVLIIKIRYKLESKLKRKRMWKGQRERKKWDMWKFEKEI